MASSLDEIAGLMEKLGLKFLLDDEHDIIVTVFGTAVYRNYRDDARRVIVAIKIDDGGPFLSLAAHYCYVTSTRARYRPVVLACATANDSLRVGRFGIDKNDGEVRLVVQYPLLDTPLTAPLLCYLLQLFPFALDRYDELIRTAVETGEVIDIDDPAEREFLEFAAARRGRRGIVAGKCSSIVQ